MRISLVELANFLQADVVYGNLDKEISGAAIDTRKVTLGKIFFALKGEKTDGHQFVTAAAEAGAVAAIIEKDVVYPPEPFTLLKVKSVKTALQKCAELARIKFHGTVIGVTGSNGKTTTKDLISEVLSQGFSTQKTFANFNNEIGVPLTILNCPEYKEALVVEMGMRALGEIALLADIAKPKVGVVTNVGITHLEILKSQKNIAGAKFELISALPADGCAILNADDEWCVRLAPSTCKVVFYGFSETAQIRCTDMRIGTRGTTFTVSYLDNEYEAFLPTWGRHNVSNALAALAVGMCLGMRMETAIKGLQHYQPSPMRLEIKTGKSGFCILDDVYNANPISTSASLEVLRSITDGRTIAVLGEMYELGDMEEEGHINVGKKVSELGIDILVTVGKIAAKIAKGAADSGMKMSNIHVFADNETAVNYLKSCLDSKDTVLVKGSRGMKMETIVSALT